MTPPADHGAPDQSACGASDAAAPPNTGEDYADFAEPLRGDLQYLEAGLSFYWGSPADADVRGAWDRMMTAFRDVRADYLRLLHEKVDRLSAAFADGVGRAPRPPVIDGESSRDEPLNPSQDPTHGR